MLDRESALAGHLVPGQYGSVGKPGVFIQEVPNLFIHQLAAWPGSVSKVRLHACKVAASTAEPDTACAVVGKSASVLHVEPLKWWIVGDSAVEIDLDPALGVALDLSQSRSCLYLSGAQAATLLNRHVSLDFRERSCPADAVMSTGFHHVGITIWRRADGFVLFLLRSFAASLSELLCESAEQFGYELLESGREPPWQPGEG